ncbi:c-type cytochrome [Sulfurimonas sp.]|uniref:c-type cytochrome n=1 Tax=Sulfurimonas sp. TaxID=2022749 RepID=UPI0025FA50D2|nr:c-type cytochrome [Sulfurimonas sp.]MDD5156664.1 c-type cytochrome [Sulfurimonas sp.]
MKLKILLVIFTSTATLSMADGASVFKRCMVCHGEHGEKKSLGVSEIIAGWKEEKIIEKLKAYKANKLNQYGFSSMMSGQAVKLSDADIKDVASYISTLTPPQPPVDENAYSDEVLTPEQIEYKNFMRDYFIANPQYGTIIEATKLWEEKKLKK